MQCAPGTPVGQCTQTIEGTWMPVPASQPNVHLVKVWHDHHDIVHAPVTTWCHILKRRASRAQAHFHCHAPTCLKMEMWNNDTGALLCRQEPVYGGTGVIDRADYDEERYIATPPCMVRRRDVKHAPAATLTPSPPGVAVARITRAHRSRGRVHACRSGALPSTGSSLRLS